MRQAFWYLAAQRRRKIGDHFVKGCVRMCAVQEFEQIFAERLVVIHSEESSPIRMATAPLGTQKMSPALPAFRLSRPCQSHGRSVASATVLSDQRKRLLQLALSGSTSVSGLRDVRSARPCCVLQNEQNSQVLPPVAIPSIATPQPARC